MAICRTDLVNALAQHRGRANGIHIDALTLKLGGAGERDERKVRKLIEALRREGAMAVCGRPNTGYFLADTSAELEETCDFLMRRALTSLKQVSVLKNVAMADLVGQLRLNQA